MEKRRTPWMAARLSSPCTVVFINFAPLVYAEKARSNLMGSPGQVIVECFENMFHKCRLNMVMRKRRPCVINLIMHLDDKLFSSYTLTVEISYTLQWSYGLKSAFVTAFGHVVTLTFDPQI